MWHKTSGGTTLGRYQYTYDSGGNVTQRTDNDGSITGFGYDSADQLTSESRTNSSSNYSISYTYDHNANRKTKVVGGVTDTYSYDSHDHLSSTSSKSFTYDLNGNCTAVTVGGSTTTLSYDYENRVTGITYPSSATNSFQYNGLGLRTRKVDSTGTVNYVCDGTTRASPVLADTNATYTPGLSERRGTTSKFQHSDALGTTRGITGSTQTATDGLLFDAFGMSVSRTGTTPTPFGFVGAAQYQTDGDSGLLLLGHRYYDPSIGRFISQDPIQDGDNWYAYCGNDPLVRMDPTGKIVWLLVAAVVLISIDLMTHSDPPAGEPPAGGYRYPKDVVPYASAFLPEPLNWPGAVWWLGDGYRAGGPFVPIGTISYGPGPVFPPTAGEMDGLLGFEGERIPDLPSTPGRGKVVWRPSDDVKITGEQHPYHPGVPGHSDWHYHLDYPGTKHQRHLPGDPFP